MPFKSEKQRRFLWAEHPDLAKRWAHEYPDSNKNLPMYAPKKPDEKADQPQPKEKAATVNISAIVNKYVNNGIINFTYTAAQTMAEMNKTADSKQERVAIPSSEKPVYAGEEREKGKITGAIPDGKNISETNTEGVKKPQNAINELLTKLSVVLSPHIEQTMENLKAEREGRVAVRIPKNRGIKKYPCATPSIPLPYGMAQTQAQPQQQTAQNQPQPARPVGGGSHPQFNPINAFGAISATGVINGNAAFGAKNSPDSSKLSCFIPAAINRNKQASRSEILGKIMSMDAASSDLPYLDEELVEELAGYQKAAKDNKTTPCSCGCGDTITTCKCAQSCSCKQPGGSCYKPKEKDADTVKYSLADTLKLARCWAGYEPVPGKKPYSNDSCRPVGSGKKKKKEEAKSEKEAGTPAWQRSEGKNEAGGLNEKGRKSYEREHGGNLKAPVTESKPTGERAKRQNSFCSRMCGMKRVNTGAKTKSDPDSRINKSLRKWNCKCSSAMAFGADMAGEKQANPLALAARMAKPGWSAVQAALRASKGALPVAAKATARTATTADNLLPALGSKAHQAIQGTIQNLYSHPAAKYVADHTGKGFAGLYDTVKGMAHMGDDAIAKVIGPRFKELQTNAVTAQRMAAGNLKVPRPKPVGFSDVTGKDWAALSGEWDKYDAVRHAAGL